MAQIPFMTEDGRLMYIDNAGIGRYVTDETPRITPEIMMLYRAHMDLPNHSQLPTGEIARIFLLHLFHAIDSQQWPMEG